MGNCFDDEKPRKEIVAQKIPEDSKNKKGSSNKNDNNKIKKPKNLSGIIEVFCYVKMKFIVSNKIKFKS